MPSTAEWLNGYNDMVGLYHQESDRAAAILATSVLDAFLGDAIKGFLVDDSSVDELFIGYGPLSTFSARINIAFALGLIGKHARSDLNALRKVRNHFAHHPTGLSFADSPVRELCASLSMSRPLPSQGGETFQVKDPRIQFLVTLGMTMQLIHQTVSKEQRRVVHPFGRLPGG